MWFGVRNDVNPFMRYTCHLFKSLGLNHDINIWKSNFCRKNVGIRIYTEFSGLLSSIWCLFRISNIRRYSKYSSSCEINLDYAIVIFGNVSAIPKTSAGYRNWIDRVGYIRDGMASNVGFLVIRVGRNALFSAYNR